nr:MAG TPA: hypothetical protein [Caudoviricetes sp.]
MPKEQRIMLTKFAGFFYVCYKYWRLLFQITFVLFGGLT